ncbi:MAG TPA: hypothetical protein DEG69_14390, partial [Flavobacteriaceae bacterium]|nr:hypothetical protein [Flavobacteriaceae bacterium]
GMATSQIWARIFNYLDEKQVGTSNPNIFNILSSKGISIDFKQAVTSTTLEDTTDDDSTTDGITGLENEDTSDNQYQKNIDMLNKINLSETYKKIFSELKKSDDNKISDYKNKPYYDLTFFKAAPVDEGIETSVGTEGDPTNVTGGEGSFTPPELNESFIKTTSLEPEFTAAKSGDNILSKIIEKLKKIHTENPEGPIEFFFQKKVREMPIQLKSLLMNSSVPPSFTGATNFIKANNSVQPSDENDFALWANFKNLVRVEFLSGLDGIMSPKWETLKELPETTNGNKLLCRLVKFEDTDYNIVRPKSYELPIYNEYFLIKL